MRGPVVVVLIAAIAALFPFARSSLCQGDVAKVNGEPIARSALVERLLEQSTIGQAVLEQMIGEALLRQYAQKKDVRVTDEEVQARIEQMRKSQTPAVFEQYLRANGITQKGLAGAVRTKMLAEKFFGEQAAVSEEEVRRVYDAEKEAFNVPATVTVRVLLAASEEQVKAARSRVVAGESFEAVARAVSTHMPTRPAGGLIGPATKEALERLFKGAGETAFSVEVGQVSQPVKSEDGWWLMKVEERKAAVTRSFDDVKEQIRADIKDVRLGEAYRNWLFRALKDPSNKIERML